MNKLTIQINNLEALERLIGGDSEVEVDIRNSVVQKFAEKHLKPLANTPEVSDTLTRIREDISKQIRDRCEKEVATFKTSWGGSITDVKLASPILLELNSQVRNVVDETVRKAVDEALKLWANDAELKKRIKQRFEYYTKEHINVEIKARLEKVKASLG